MLDTKRFETLLDTLTLDDLRDLNRMVVARINDIHRERQARALSRFRTGDLIEFVDERARRKVRALVERINSKTMTVREVESRASWRVSPSLCRLVGS